MDGGYWNPHKQFEELSSAFWIAHNQMITDEEAIEGGDYLFEKSFKLDINTDNILEAKLYLTVDNHCLVSINKTDVGHFTGYNNLSIVDIKKYLSKGINKINFKVNNDRIPALNTPKWNQAKGHKGSINPYGIKYNLRIFLK